MTIETLPWPAGISVIRSVGSFQRAAHPPIATAEEYPQEHDITFGRRSDLSTGLPLEYDVVQWRLIAISSPKLRCQLVGAAQFRSHASICMMSGPGSCDKPLSSV
jgi:hypothetical protein